MKIARRLWRELLTASPSSGQRGIEIVTQTPFPFVRGKPPLTHLIEGYSRLLPTSDSASALQRCESVNNARPESQGGNREETTRRIGYQGKNQS